jgi:outer membrane receptor protein involved in Fe transport
MNDLNRTLLRTALLASAAAGAWLATPTFAAAAPAPAAASDVNVGEIVVTGSRIRRDTFDTPLPMASVNDQQIRQSGNAVLGDILNDLPQVEINSSSQNTSSTLFQSGQARVDIRGLGSNRTLVLMDGRRLPIGDASSPAVDLNLIPSLMIDRVDVLPGGQSAVYGSEAIAGVVNLIMKKSFEGFQLDIQGGTSQHWDGQQSLIGVLYGRHFNDDRGSVLIGAEYGKEEPIFQKDRADEGLFPGIRRNSAVGVTTQGILPASRSSTSPYATFEIRPDVGVSLANPFGTNNPIAATIDVRNPTQIVQLSPACSLRTVNPTCQDPSLFYSAVYNALQNKTVRGTVRGYADYKLTDHVKAFVEFSAARADAYGYFQPAFSSTAGGGTLPVVFKGDNAYLQGATTADQQLRALITGAGLPLTSATTINVGKFWQEFGRRDVYTRRHQERAVIGMNGDFDAFGRNFAWDWYAQTGHLRGTTESFGVPNIQKTIWANDPVLSNGQIVCRATVPGSATFNANAAGCVPWDIINGPSKAAVAYANAYSTTVQQATQNVVAGNINFDLVRLPAGPLGVAMGLEHREEKSSFAQDALGASGALFINSVGTRAGKFEVTEGYIETRVPILKDLPFAKSLTFEYAIRSANYSTIHSTSQYRIAGEWAPVDDIRFRASKATAVRAPNIVELFAPQSRNFTTAAVDPCDATAFAAASAAQQAARRVTCAAAIPGWSPTTFQSNIGPGRPSLALLQGGNPKLGPESAVTFDYGAVIQPRWVPNLKFSIDYFKYNISNVVGTIPINTLFQNLCYDDPTTPYASNQFCKNIQRDPTGTNGGAVAGGVIQAILTNQNVAKRKVEGYDYAASYAFDVADVLKDKDWGRITMRVDATWLYRYAIQGLPGQLYTNFANTLDNALPRWKGLGTLNWKYDKISLSWTTHYFGSMKSNSAVLPTALDPYYTGDWWMHDLRGNYKLNDKTDLRAGILNITNEYPPYLPEAFAGTGSGSSTYDNRGRFFYVGASLRY